MPRCSNDRRDKDAQENYIKARQENVNAELWIGLRVVNL